jgi:FkbM family methyltransferase
MQLHLANLKPNGLIRVAWHLSAGYRLCGRSLFKLKTFLPDGIPSMSTAHNLARAMKSLPPPKTILDVGANVSQMTKLLLLLWPDAKVLSFEPNPALKPLGRVFHIALSDTDEIVEFYIPADSTWATVVKSKAAHFDAKAVQVQANRFDSLLLKGDISRNEMPHPIFLKVDTEGCEYNTLKGFGKFLLEVEYLMLEVTNPHESSSDSLPVFKLLSEYGFTRCKYLFVGHEGSSMPDYMDVLFWKG